jgi:hypothetical protein
MADGQKQEDQVLVKGMKPYLDKRLDVHWGVVRKV